MEEDEHDYTIDELILFVIRNGFARIIMSTLLIICYVRAMCEKQQLWILLSTFCYTGLVFLIVDWWIILLKIHVYRKIREYFWINTGVAIFITFTMPPLWFLRYVYFVQSVRDSKVQAKQANINLDSYVRECWNLKERKQLQSMQFELGARNQAISTIDINNDECYRNENITRENWCVYGICLMKQMPDEMLEQVVVLSAICFRWMITGNLGLDQLITYFISTASDIVDFASTMVGQSEQLIQDKNQNIMKAIIAAYFISLSQFSVNLSGKRKHDHIYDTILWSNATIRQRCLILIDFLFGTEIWGIVAQMVTEDGLLLALRIVAVVKFDASTLENLFFVVKNILTIAIFTYYAAVISDSYIRHRYRYQQYVRTMIQQVSQELISHKKQTVEKS